MPASPSSACSSSAPIRRPKWRTPSRKCSARSRISTAFSARPSNTPTGGSATRAARRRRSPRRRIGYKQQVVAEAEGESQRFLSVLGEYQRAEDVTRKRLYLETIERVFQSSNKIILEGGAGRGRAALPAARPAAAQPARGPADRPPRRGRRSPRRVAPLQGAGQ